MTIQFIRDKASEEGRKQLELINKIINEKQIKVSKETKFLRKFTLAILQQYNHKLNFNMPRIENKEFNEKAKDILVPEKIELNLLPEVPKPIEIKFNLEAPKKIDLN
jgi:hypothetical protein